MESRVDIEHVLVLNRPLNGDGTYSYVINDTGFTKEAKAHM